MSLKAAWLLCPVSKD